MSKEIIYVDEVKCPYCEHEIKNSLNDIFNKEIVYTHDDTDYECPSCEKIFTITISNLELGDLINDNEDYGRELEGFEVIVSTIEVN